MKCYYQAQDKQYFQASLLKSVEHTSMSYKLVTQFRLDIQYA